MIRWRLTIAAFLLGFVAVPLAAPLGLLASDPSAWRAWAEAPRLLLLARNTLFLIAGTLSLAMPLGVVVAVLLYRTDLPGRHLWRLLMVLTLFVPLPLFTSGWQTVFGSGGWLPLPAWSGDLLHHRHLYPNALRRHLRTGGALRPAAPPRRCGRQRRGRDRPSARLTGCASGLGQ